MNSISSGQILRIPIGKDGSAGGVTAIKLTQPLNGPDGMRALRPNTFLVAEGRAGQLDLVTVENDEAKVVVLKKGLTGISAVTMVGDTAWVNDMKSSMMRDPASDPGTFTLKNLPLPKQ